jgi:hypothetical protein
MYGRAPPPADALHTLKKAELDFESDCYHGDCGDRGNVHLNLLPSIPEESECDRGDYGDRGSVLRLEEPRDSAQLRGDRGPSGDVHVPNRSFSQVVPKPSSTSELG